MKFNITCEEAIEPKCQHFRECGGCKFQHVPYNEQLNQKSQYIQECFGKEVEPIIACEPPWHYRNKMEYSFSQARSGDKFLGLMKRRGRVENLEMCYLTHSWFIETLVNVREWWLSTSLTAYHPPKNTGLLRTLTLREGFHSKEKMAILTVSEEPFEDSDLQFFIETIPQVDSLILRRQIIKRKTPTRFEETVLRGKDHIHEHLHNEEGKSYCFRIRAASFFQPNTLQAEVIYQKALELADLNENESVLDLYCGTGSFGIFAADRVKEVVGVEIVPEAVEDGRENLELNHITNMRLLEGDVAEVLADSTFQPSTVIVDPPRVGLGGKAIRQLLKLAPQKIVYVSCNPASQAADCEELGYEIVTLQPIDQFPHTPHMENIALLRKLS